MHFLFLPLVEIHNILTMVMVQVHKVMMTIMAKVSILYEHLQIDMIFKETKTELLEKIIVWQWTCPLSTDSGWSAGGGSFGKAPPAPRGGRGRPHPYGNARGGYWWLEFPHMPTVLSRIFHTSIYWRYFVTFAAFD